MVRVTNPGSGGSSTPQEVNKLKFTRTTEWEVNQGGSPQHLLSGTFVPEREEIEVEFESNLLHSGIAHMNMVFGCVPGTTGPTRPPYYANPLPAGAKNVPLVTFRQHGSVFSKTTVSGLTPGITYFFEVFCPVVGYSHSTDLGVGTGLVYNAATSPDGRFVYTITLNPQGLPTTSTLLKKWRVPTTVDEVNDYVENSDKLESSLEIPNSSFGAIANDHITSDGKTLYVSTGTGVIEVNLSTMTVVATHSNLVPAGQACTGSVISRDGQNLYILGYGATGVQNTLRKFARSNLAAPIWSINLGVNLRRSGLIMSPDGTKIGVPGAVEGGNFVIIVQDQGASANPLLYGLNVGTPVHFLVWKSNTELWVASGTNLHRTNIPDNITSENSAGVIAETIALGGNVSSMASDPKSNSLFIGLSSGTYRLQCLYSNHPFPSFVGKLWERATLSGLGGAYPMVMLSNLRGDIIYVGSDKRLLTLDGGHAKLFAQPDLFWGTKVNLTLMNAVAP